jgi:type IV pilus assembly protein PilE
MNLSCSRSGARAAMRGFSLAELMITVAIVGIIASIAIPSYRSYMLAANRTDAIRALTFAQQELERCYSQNFSYLDVANDCPASATIVANTLHGDYSITIPVWTATTYTLQATAIGGQIADKQCEQMTITNTNQQGSLDNNNNVTTSTCWGSN